MGCLEEQKNGGASAASAAAASELKGAKGSGKRRKSDAPSLVNWYVRSAFDKDFRRPPSPSLFSSLLPPPPLSGYPGRTAREALIISPHSLDRRPCVLRIFATKKLHLLNFSALIPIKHEFKSILISP